MILHDFILISFMISFMISWSCIYDIRNLWYHRSSLFQWHPPPTLHLAEHCQSNTWKHQAQQFQNWQWWSVVLPDKAWPVILVQHSQTGNVICCQPKWQRGALWNSLLACCCMQGGASWSIPAHKLYNYLGRTSNQVIPQPVLQLESETGIWPEDWEWRCAPLAWCTGNFAYCGIRRTLLAWMCTVLEHIGFSLQARVLVLEKKFYLDVACQLEAQSFKLVNTGSSWLGSTTPWQNHLEPRRGI